MTNKKRGLYKKGMNRREFMSTAIAAGLTVSSAAAIWSTQANAAVPTKGGRLRIGTTQGSASDSLDTGKLYGAHIRHISMGQLRNCLVEIDADGNPQPELATEWDSSQSADRWTFKIRSGVEFHNGKTLTARDVAHSINYHRGQDSKSFFKSVANRISSVKTDGDTVVFSLKEGNADFPMWMAEAAFGIVPAGTSSKDMEKGIGTGGYMLVSHSPGIRTLTKRNPNYWKEERANFDEVENISFSDVVARTSALTDGQVDVIHQCDAHTFSRLGQTPGIVPFKTTGTRHYTMPMHCDVRPFSELDLRLALKYAIDREAILKLLFDGHGEVGNDHPIGPSNRYFNRALPQRLYDPDRARYHFKLAGVSDRKLQLHASDASFPKAIEAAELFRRHASAAGINVKVIRAPRDGFWSNVWLKKPWTMVHWTGRATEDTMFSLGYAAGAPWNESRWNNARFNRLLKAGRLELDPLRRAQIYGEMQEICHNDGGSIIPVFVSDLHAISDKIGHRRIAANLELDGFRAAERWWFRGEGEGADCDPATSSTPCGLPDHVGAARDGGGPGNQKDGGQGASGHSSGGGGQGD